MTDCGICGWPLDALAVQLGEGAHEWCEAIPSAYCRPGCPEGPCCLKTPTRLIHTVPVSEARL